LKLFENVTGPVFWNHSVEPIVYCCVQQLPCETETYYLQHALMLVIPYFMLRLRGVKAYLLLSVNQLVVDETFIVILQSSMNESEIQTDSVIRNRIQCKL